MVARSYDFLGKKIVGMWTTARDSRCGRKRSRSRSKARRRYVVFNFNILSFYCLCQNVFIDGLVYQRKKKEHVLYIYPKRPAHYSKL